MRLDEQEFLEQVETSDLLLCIRKNEVRNVSGKHKIQDVFTLIYMQSEGEEAEYFVLRSAPLEQGGVVIDTWEAFKDYLKISIHQGKYSDVLYRHLYCERN